MYQDGLDVRWLLLSQGFKVMYLGTEDLIATRQHSELGMV